MTNERSEIGRQLRVDELHEKTVVVIRREDRDVGLTVWVSEIDAEFVTFYGGAAKPPITFMTFRKPDDTLVDDTGQQILVHEYLGEV